MRAASERFAAAVGGSHRVVTRVEVWRGANLLLDDLPLASGGDLKVDGEDSVPGELTLPVPGSEDLVPRDPFAPLAPFGQRLYVRRGIRYLDGREELLDLGWYQIESADPDYLAGGLRVVAKSLEQTLDDALLTNGRQPPSGATFLSELEAIVGQRVPVSDELPTGVTNRTIPSSRFWEPGSRRAVLDQLAAAWPARFRVDDQGLLRILPPVEKLDRTPVLTIATGERGVVASWASPTSREEIYNAVVARGEESGADAKPVLGFAYDAEPSSPTYYGGPFGMKPLEWSSPLLTTAAQAKTAAQTMLNRRLRRTRTVQVEMIPDPRIQVDDYVRLDTPRIKGVGRVASYVMPLDPEVGTLTLDDFREES